MDDTHTLSLPAHTHHKVIDNPKSPISSFSSTSSQRVTDSFTSQMYARNSLNSCSNDTNTSYPVVVATRAATLSCKDAIDRQKLNTMTMVMEDEEDAVVRSSASRHLVLSPKTSHNELTTPKTSLDTARHNAARINRNNSSNDNNSIGGNNNNNGMKRVINKSLCVADCATAAHGMRLSCTKTPPARSHRRSSRSTTSSLPSSMKACQPTFVYEYVYYPEKVNASRRQHAEEQKNQHQQQQQHTEGGVCDEGHVHHSMCSARSARLSSFMGRCATRHAKLRSGSRSSTENEAVNHTNPEHSMVLKTMNENSSAMDTSSSTLNNNNSGAHIDSNDNNGSNDVEECTSELSCGHITRQDSNSMTLTPYHPQVPHLLTCTSSSSSLDAAPDTAMHTLLRHYQKRLHHVDTLTARCVHVLDRRHNEAAMLRLELKELEQLARGYADRITAVRQEARQLASAVHTREELEMLVYMYTECVTRVETLQSRRRDLEQMSAQLQLLCASVDEQPSSQLLAEEADMEVGDNVGGRDERHDASRVCSSAKENALGAHGSHTQQHEMLLSSHDTSDRSPLCSRQQQQEQQNTVGGEGMLITPDVHHNAASREQSATKSLSPASRVVFGNFLSDLLSEVEMLTRVCIQLPCAQTSTAQQSRCSQPERIPGDTNRCYTTNTNNCYYDNSDSFKAARMQDQIAVTAVPAAEVEHTRDKSEQRPLLGQDASGSSPASNESAQRQGGFYSFFGGATEEHLSAKPLPTFLACATRLNRHAWELEEELQLRARELEDEKGDEELRQRLVAMASSANGCSAVQQAATTTTASIAASSCSYTLASTHASPQENRTRVPGKLTQRSSDDEDGDDTSLAVCCTMNSVNAVNVAQEQEKSSMKRDAELDKDDVEDVARPLSTLRGSTRHTALLSATASHITPQHATATSRNAAATDTQEAKRVSIPTTTIAEANTSKSASTIVLPPIHYAHPRLIWLSKQLDEQQLLLLQRYRSEGARLREERRVLVHAMRAAYRAHEEPALRACRSALRAQQESLARAMLDLGVVTVELQWREQRGAIECGAVVDVSSCPQSNAHAPQSLCDRGDDAAAGAHCVAAGREDSVDRQLVQWYVQEMRAKESRHSGCSERRQKEGRAHKRIDPRRTRANSDACGHQSGNAAHGSTTSVVHHTCDAAKTNNHNNSGCTEDASPRHDHDDGSVVKDSNANLLVPPSVQTLVHGTSSPVATSTPISSSRTCSSSSSSSSASSGRNRGSICSNMEGTRGSINHHSHSGSSHHRSMALDHIRHMIIEIKAAQATPPFSTAAAAQFTRHRDAINSAATEKEAKLDGNSLSKTLSSKQSLHSDEPAPPSASRHIDCGDAVAITPSSVISRKDELDETAVSTLASSYTTQQLDQQRPRVSDSNRSTAASAASHFCADALISQRSSISFIEEEECEMPTVRPTVLRSFVPLSRQRRRGGAAQSNGDEEDESESDSVDSGMDGDRGKTVHTHRNNSFAHARNSSRNNKHNSTAKADCADQDEQEDTSSTISFLQQSVDSDTLMLSTKHRSSRESALPVCNESTRNVDVCGIPASSAAARDHTYTCVGAHTGTHSPIELRSGNDLLDYNCCYSATHIHGDSNSSNNRSSGVFRTSRCNRHDTAAAPSAAPQAAPVLIRVIQSRTPVQLPSESARSSRSNALHTMKLATTTTTASSPRGSPQIKQDYPSYRRTSSCNPIYPHWTSSSLLLSPEGEGAVQVSVQFVGAAAQQRHEAARREEQLSRMRWQLREELARLEELNFVHHSELVELEERHTAQRCRNTARVREAVTKMTEAKELLRSLTHEHNDWIAMLAELQSLVKDKTRNPTPASSAGLDEAD